MAGRATFGSVAIVLMLVIMLRPAYAYIDPGTGSMFLQVIAAAALAAMFWWRMMWTRIGEWLRFLRHKIGGGRAPGPPES